MPGKSHGQRSLAGYSPRGHKTVRHDWAQHTKYFDPEMKIGITVLLKDIWSKQKATKMNYMTSSLYTEQFNLQHFKLHYFKSVLHFYPHYSVVKNIRRNRFFPGR